MWDMTGWGCRRQAASPTGFAAECELFLPWIAGGSMSPLQAEQVADLGSHVVAQVGFELT